MLELDNSFHKSRPDDGSKRYHSHCVKCRRTVFKESREIKLKQFNIEIDFENLIPMSSGTHSMIHKMY